jgi:RNase P subunit RPR2
MNKQFVCKKCGKKEKFSNLDEIRKKWKQFICNNCNDFWHNFVKENARSEISCIATGLLFNSVKDK